MQHKNNKRSSRTSFSLADLSEYFRAKMFLFRSKSPSKKIKKYEKEYAEFCRRHDYFPTESRTLPRTPPNRGELLSPYLVRKIPDENLESYFSDSSYKSSNHRDNSSSPEDSRRLSPTSKSKKGRKSAERSTSMEGRRPDRCYNPGGPFASMTLNRNVGRKRNKQEFSSGFVRLTRRDAMIPDPASNGTIVEERVQSYLDENFNHDNQKKGHTLMRFKKKDSTTDSEDELFIPRSNTLGSSPRSFKKSPKQTSKSESDDSSRMDLTLDDMLRNKGALQAFREFLKSEHSEENLDFWMDCEQYKTLKGIKQDRLAVRIFTHYLSASAPREVNIDSEIRTRTAELLKNPDKETFVDAQNCIYCLMKSDPFRRFLASERFSRLDLKKSTLKKK